MSRQPPPDVPPAPAKPKPAGFLVFYPGGKDGGHFTLMHIDSLPTSVNEHKSMYPKTAWKELNAEDMKMHYRDLVHKYGPSLRS